jgi:hypothetical protein
VNLRKSPMMGSETMERGAGEIFVGHDDLAWIWRHDGPFSSIVAPGEIERREKKAPTWRETRGGATLASAASPVVSALAFLNIQASLSGREKARAREAAASGPWKCHR